MNPSSQPPTAWERIVAARRAGMGAPPAEEELPPPGLATRIAARWAELRQNEQFRLWSRWSLRAAIGGLLAAAVVTLFSDPQTHGGGLTAPEIELPVFSAP